MAGGGEGGVGYKCNKETQRTAGRLSQSIQTIGGTPRIPCEPIPGTYMLAISQAVCSTSPCSPIHRLKRSPPFSPGALLPPPFLPAMPGWFFKTNENGTQEAKWIHLALRSPLPCCYLFLCISLEATFVNMAAEKPQARESWWGFVVAVVVVLYKTSRQYRSSFE